MTTTKRIGLALLAGSLLCPAGAAQDLVISNARILDGTGNAIERGTRRRARGPHRGRRRERRRAPPANAVRDRRRRAHRDAGLHRRAPPHHSGRPGALARRAVGGQHARVSSKPGSRRSSRRSIRSTRSSSCADARRAARPSDRASSPRRSCRCRAPCSAAAASIPARTDPARAPNRPGPTAPGIPPEDTLAAVRAAAARGVDAIKTLIIVTRDGPGAGDAEAHRRRDRARWAS